MIHFYWKKKMCAPSMSSSSQSKEVKIHVISDGITRLPVIAGEISCIEIPRNRQPLGVTVVGGIDTPLKCVVLQEIIANGIIARDGRLRPGDQIIEVDGIDVTSVTHREACDIMRHPFSVLKIAVYREFVDTIMKTYLNVDSFEGSQNVSATDMHKKTLNTPKHISEHFSNRNQFVNDSDISECTNYCNWTPEKTSKTYDYNENFVKQYKNSERSFSQTPSTDNAIISILKFFTRYKTYQEPTNSQVTKTLIKKKSSEGIGIKIGGGLNSAEGDTPIYIVNINKNSPLGRIGTIKKGDLLLAMNGQSLHGVTESQSQSILKTAIEMTKITLMTLPRPQMCVDETADFSPSWLYWQNIPRILQFSRKIELHRPTADESLGFSVIGGCDRLKKLSEPIHILFIVPNSLAAVDGRLKCGDRLLSVNNKSFEYYSHGEVVSMLKRAGQHVSLEVLSSIGSVA